MAEETVIKKKNLLTKEWYEKLIAEKQEILEVKIPENLKTISEAKAMLETHHNKGLKAYVDKADEDDVMVTGVRLKFENKETVEIIE